MEFPAGFICATTELCGFAHAVPAPYLRKSFCLEGPVKQASLLLCGLGFYRLFVNGQELTKGPLAPYISAADDVYYYDAYELSPYLRQGENVLGVQLGNGMQNCFGGATWDFDKASWRSAPKLSLRLEATLETGERLVLEGDESFRAHPSPLIFDDLRSGAHYDARKELPGWSLPGYDDSAWDNALPAQTPKGEPRLCAAQPIVVTREITPVSVVAQPDGYLYDFGENCAGVCRLTVRGRAGQEISLVHGEYLDNGRLTVKNIQFLPDGYVQKDVYLCKGEGEEQFIPCFTYHGFRYVLVTGITPEQAQKSLLTYLVMNSDLQERGGFACSDPVLNQIQEITRRSTLSNFYYFPTDCPHREKNGWTGDATLSAEHTLLNLDPEQSYREWLCGIRKAQTEQGAIPGIVPTGGWGFHWGNGPAWDSVLINLPYYTYLYRGDRRILEENATLIFRYLHYMTTRLNGDGLAEYGLGDWCTPGRRCDDVPAPLVVTDTMTCLDICRKAAFVFRTLGMDLQEQFAASLHDQLRDAARAHLIVDGTLTVLGDCQTSQAMGLAYGLFASGERQQAFAVLLEQIRRADHHMTTGILGAREIFHVLSEFGRSDLAYEMITQPDYPSYANWIARGATTLWEEFQPEGGNVASLNHHFFGDVSAWFIKRLAGIQLNPYERSCDEVRIQPRIIPQLQQAEGYHQAPLGRIAVSWRRVQQEVLLHVEVPAGMTGSIVMSDGYLFGDGSAVKPVSTGDYQVVRA